MTTDQSPSSHEPSEPEANLAPESFEAQSPALEGALGDPPIAAGPLETVLPGPIASVEDATLLPPRIMDTAPTRRSEAEAPLPEAERYLVVPVLDTEDGARYVLVRWPDWPHPAMLSLSPPPAHDSVAAAVATLLDARLRLIPTAPPRMTEVRIPVRMPNPRVGHTDIGWLRPLVINVEGTPEPDVLLAGFELLTLDAALDALPTDIERTVLREAARALEGTGPEG